MSVGDISGAADKDKEPGFISYNVRQKELAKKHHSLGWALFFQVRG